MVLYVVGNNINAEWMRDHNDKLMIKAYQALWAGTSQKRKEKPKLHILDCKSSTDFKAEMKKLASISLFNRKHIDAIWPRAQAFKSHFMAIFAGIHLTFLMSLWEKLLL